MKKLFSILVWLGVGLAFLLLPLSMFAQQQGVYANTDGTLKTPTNFFTANASALSALVGGSFQPLDSDLTSIAALSTTSFGRSLLTQADAPTLRMTAGLAIGTNVEAWSANLDTWAGKTPFAGSVVVTTGKTFTSSNTITLTATDGSTLAIGTGGTLGTAAFTSSGAYEVPLTFSTGLTRSTNTITVNASQSISTLSNLTSNGYVKTSGGTGALSVASTVPTTDLTGTLAAGQFPALTGDATTSAGSLSVTVGKVNGVAFSGLATGILKNTTTTGVPSIAVAGTDYAAAGSYITALTSDVTASGPGSVAATIAANAVTNAKAAQMSANTFKANNTGSTANAADITVAQAKTLLAIAQADVSGLTTGSSPTLAGLTLSTTPLAAGSGGTGNGFTAFTGPATSTKTFTLPNATATILTDNALVTGAQGGTGVNNSGKTITLGGNLTTSGAFGTTVTVSGTTAVTLPTAGTLVGSSDTGTVTNTMLAGSIANAKLTNNSVTVGSTSVALGGTAATVAGLTLTAPILNGGTHTAITGLGIRSTGSGAFDLTLANSENLTAGRTLTIATGDVARTLTLTGNASITGTNTGDQTITLTGDATGSGTGSFAVNVGKVNGTSLGGLATGILKNTTTTGVPSIAAAATDYVAPSAYASANGLTMATARLLGRSTAATGAAEEITVGSGLTLSAGTLSSSASGGTVTNTGGNLTANAVVLGAGTVDTKVVAGITTDGTSKLTLGVAGTSVGSVDFKNATSGTITVAPVTGALGAVTLSLPAATDTLVGKATTDTLTNKTLTSPTINGGTNTALTGLGIRSTGAAFDLTLASSEVFTAGRTLSFNLGDAARTLTLSGNPTLSGFTATGTGTLALGAKNLTVSNTLTLAGTDSTTMTFPTTSATIARTDAANTFTGTQTISTITAPASTDLTLNAGSGNQNITLTPSGTGFGLITGTSALKFGATALASIAVSADTTAGNLTFTGTTTGKFLFNSPAGQPQWVFNHVGGTNPTIALQEGGSSTLTFNTSNGTAQIGASGNLQLRSSSATSLTISGGATPTLLWAGTGVAKFGATAAATIGVSADTTAGIFQIKSPSSGSITLSSGNATALTLDSSQNATFAGALSVTGHTTFEGVTSTGATGTGNLVFATAPSITTPVIAGGLTASGSGANTFVGSSGTFITSTGANTLSGATTINDATTPSLTTASGKTNTGFVQVNGKTSGALKLIAADAAAQTVTVSLAAQTTGASTQTIPDMAGTSDTFVFLAKTQTLTNKTLTAPVMSTIVNTGTLTIPTSTDTLVGRATTDTLTNKRVTIRTNTVASSATPSVNTDTTDEFTITALAVAITSMTTNLTGTPVNGDMLLVRIKDNGTARSITWGVSFRQCGATLPTTTVISKTLYILFIWNSTDSIWDCVSTAQQT